MSVIYKLSHKVLKNQCLWISWKNKNETTFSFYSWLNQRLVVVYKNERPYKHKIKRYRFRYHPLESPWFPSSPPPSEACCTYQRSPPREKKERNRSSMSSIASECQWIASWWLCDRERTAWDFFSKCLLNNRLGKFSKGFIFVEEWKWSGIPPLTPPVKVKVLFTASDL